MSADDLSQIEDEAADWAILLSEDADNEQLRQRWRSWLGTSSEHQRIWQDTLKVHRGLGLLVPTTQTLWPKADADIAEDNTRTESVPPKKRDDHNYSRSASRSPWRVKSGTFRSASRVRRSSVAGLAIAACLLLMWLPGVMLHLSSDYTTSTAEQKVVRLTDGSRLFLAPESAVDIDFTDDQRQVRLKAGTAYFEVTPDVNRPFSVDTGETRATVLGTAFNVTKNSTGVTVAVSHGKVRIQDASIKPAVNEYLLPGDKLKVHWGDRAVKTRLAASDIGRWRQGEVIARDLSMQNLVDKLRPYYNGKVMISGEFAKQRVTGVYHLNDPIETLRNLASAHGGSAIQFGPWVLVITR